MFSIDESGRTLPIDNPPHDRYPYNYIDFYSESIVSVDFYNAGYQQAEYIWHEAYYGSLNILHLFNPYETFHVEIVVKDYAIGSYEYACFYTGLTDGLQELAQYRDPNSGEITYYPIEIVETIIPNNDHYATLNILEIIVNQNEAEALIFFDEPLFLAEDYNQGEYSILNFLSNMQAAMLYSIITLLAIEYEFTEEDCESFGSPYNTGDLVLGGPLDCVWFTAPSEIGGAMGEIVYNVIFLGDSSYDGSTVIYFHHYEYNP
jgi:hypothetical protein